MLLRLFDLTQVDDEPVTLAEVKAAARIDGPEFDLLLPLNISAARRVAEHRAGRYFAARTVRAELDGWPCERLPIFPEGAVEITYWDGADWTTLAAEQYAAVWLSNGVSIQAPLAVVWPTLPLAPGALVRVDVEVAPDVDAAANAFIIAQAVFWTQNPGAAGDRKQEPSPFLTHLLDACCVYG